jgi:ribonuclease HI
MDKASKTPAANASARVVIYTDGACIGNPGPGGYAAVLLKGKRERVIIGRNAATTNNIMELTAVIKALEALRLGTLAVLHSDSQYVINGMTQWLPQWKVNRWRTAAKNPVKNRELWEHLEALASKHTITWKWVRGHSGNPMNELVDRLAEQEAQAVAQETGWSPAARYGFTTVNVNAQ